MMGEKDLVMHGGLPQWTRAQLSRRLVAAGGTTKNLGHINAERTAKLLGVSTRTLRRWLHGDPDDVVGMAPRSRAAVWAELRPSNKRLHQEDLDRSYAREALRRLALPARRRRLPPAWAKQGWLDQHMVAILDIPQANAVQVTFARMDRRPLQRMKRRGDLIDSTVVETRFHATLLAGAVLELVDPWRVKLSDQWTKQGSGQGWMVDDQAPTIDLAALAVTNDLT